MDSILSYCHYSLNDTSLQKMIPYLTQKKVGVISASPLARGLRSNREPPALHPAPAEVKEACAKAAALCCRRGVDLAKLAVQYVLANRQITTTLIGTASPENIANNVKWAEEQLDESLLKEMLDLLQPVRDKTWPSGLPENN